MSPVHVTPCMIAERRRERPPEYWDEIAPARLETFADGSAIYDQDHPAWNKAVLKYTPSRGLGDTIAKFTSAIGIPPCGGCAERQATLNRLVPYPRE